MRMSGGGDIRTLFAVAAPWLGELKTSMRVA